MYVGIISVPDSQQTGQNIRFFFILENGKLVKCIKCFKKYFLFIDLSRKKENILIYGNYQS